MHATEVSIDKNNHICFLFVTAVKAWKNLSQNSARREPSLQHCSPLANSKVARPHLSRNRGSKPWCLSAKWVDAEQGSTELCTFQHGYSNPQHAGSLFHLWINQTSSDPVPQDKYSRNKTRKLQAMLEASARRSRNTRAWTLNLTEPEGGKSDGMPMESLQRLSSVSTPVLPLWSSNSSGLSILSVWPI